MNSSNYRFMLDLHSTQSQISLPATRGDTARVWYISFSDGGAPYIIGDGILAKLEIKRPTGTHLEAFCAIEKNTTVKYDFSQDEHTAAVEGVHDCAIILYDRDGREIASPRFTMVVNERVVNSDDINITDEDQAAIGAIMAAEASRQTAEAARVNVEAERVTAEEARALAEVSRVTAEEARNIAEAARVETLRQIREAFASGVLNPIYTQVKLYASAWVGAEDPYSQVVKIAGVTAHSKVDLLPSVEQLAIFHDKDIAFVTENEDGVVTVYAIGDKPTQDYTIEVCITEVTV